MCRVQRGVLGVKKALGFALLSAMLLYLPLVAVAQPPHHLAYRFNLYESMGPLGPHGIVKISVSGLISYRLLKASNESVVYEYNITVRHASIEGLPGGNATREAFLKAFEGSSAVMINLTTCNTMLEARSRESGVVAGALPVYCTPQALERIASELKKRSGLNVSFEKSSEGYIIVAEGVRRNGATATTLHLKAVYDPRGVLERMSISISGSAGGTGSMEMRVMLERVDTQLTGSAAHQEWLQGGINPVVVAAVAAGIAAIITAIVVAARRSR